MPNIEFSKKSYINILRQAQESGYIFCPFDSDLLRNSDGRLCLLRHDIDVDIGAAMEMAKIEQGIGVRSTYFFMLRSPVYNLLSRVNHDMVKKILDMGHWIGLHYDNGYNPGHERSEVSWIDFEAEFIERLFDRNITAVSFHQPAADVLSGQVRTGNRMNTYTDATGFGFHYLSDSNRIFRESPFDVFKNKNYERLQLLIHPMWWVHENCSATEDVWDQAIVSNFIRAQHQILETERAYGAQREFKIIQKGRR